MGGETGAEEFVVREGERGWGERIASARSGREPWIS